jgi:DNA mismatch repair protein MutS
MPDDVTPIRQQYLEIKRRYPNAILFFRLGDFYETFDQDAEVAARELDIVLTGRNVAKGARVPMAGIPYHAVDSYLARLIDKGYHVAICEQVGDQPAKGLFPREVVRVVTPGTVIEPGLLHGDTNNYLASLVVQENHAGVAYVDITTGEFAATELAGDDLNNVLRAELSRLRPAEVLLPENLEIGNGFPGQVTRQPAWRFEQARCQETLLHHFEVASLDGYGLRGMPLATRAAGAIIQYLEDTQPGALDLLERFSTYQLSEFMLLDASTRRNLELTETLRGDLHGSLLGVLDRTVTPMGKRMLRQWVSKPLLDLAAITCRLDGVETCFQDGMLRAELRASLRSLADLERLVTRVLAAHAGPRDLIAIRNTLRCIPGVIASFAGVKGALADVAGQISPCTAELDLLERAIEDDPPATLNSTGIIRPGFSSELDGVVEASKHARDWIASLENVERARSGIKTLKVGYNKVFGYYIEVTRSNAESVPTEYIRKQTLVNAERFITPEMKEYEALVLNAEDRIREIENRLFRDICSRLASTSATFLQTARALAEVDVLAALAEAAALDDYTRPELVDESVLEIHEGRHPVVEGLLGGGERFVPNEAVFETGEIIRIITGPNMSGKSTFLRQAALIVLMAQMGSFVPAKAARIGLVDRIFTRIGAQDEIHAGQSTFMVEMIETSNILHHATERSLLVLDEIGRGTSTYDGLSIAWAVVEFIHNHPRLRARTLFATHYHELVQLAALLPGVRNYNVAVSDTDGKVLFLHKIVPGGADRSYGIHVAQLAGLPRQVIQRAGEILQTLEASSGHATHNRPIAAQQLALFPETNPLLDELKQLDVNTLSPLEALNKLYEWQKKYLKVD